MKRKPTKEELEAEKELTAVIQKALAAARKDMSKYGKMLSYINAGENGKPIEICALSLSTYIKDLRARSTEDLVLTVIGWMGAFTELIDDVTRSGVSVEDIIRSRRT